MAGPRCGDPGVAVCRARSGTAGGQTGGGDRGKGGQGSGTAAKGRLAGTHQQTGRKGFPGEETACGGPGGLRGSSAEGKEEVWFDWKAG